jgi:hypothetical protein
VDVEKRGTLESGKTLEAVNQAGWLPIYAGEYTEGARNAVELRSLPQGQHHNTATMNL